MVTREGLFPPGPETLPIFFKLGAQRDRGGMAGCKFILPGLCPGRRIDLAGFTVGPHELTAVDDVADPLQTYAAPELNAKTPEDVDTN